MIADRLWSTLPGLAVSLLIGCAPDVSMELVSAGETFGTSAIVNGTRDPQTVALSEAQIRSIGWLHYAGYTSQAFCTGTLIAPDLVVTAAHCVNGVSAGEIGFGVGMDPSAPEDTFLSIGVFPNPAEDAALIRLGEDVTQSGLDIVPIPINQRALDSDLVGRAVQAGGYGETYDADRDGRWFATVFVSSVYSDEIVVDGRGEQGICYGDSGSALIDLDGAGDPVVLAVESWGDESCVDIDHMTRLDPIFDWIGPVIDGVDPPDPCAGVPAEGRCVDNVAESCRRGTLRQNDCTALGTECAYIEAAERYDCVCGDLDEVGRCDGTTREYCREGRYRRSDCERWGGSCGWDASEGIYDCLGSPVCRPEDEAGRCEGEVAISCVAGRTTRRLCELEALLCVATETGVACAEPASEQDAGEGGLQTTTDEGAGQVAGGGGFTCGGITAAGSHGVAPASLLGLFALRWSRRRRAPAAR